MIENQSHLFDIPDGITYLDCASNSPLLKSGKIAADKGLERKYHPWTLNRDDMVEEGETVRGLFADLIGAKAVDIAITPSTAYGITTAANNLPLSRGQNIVVLQDQFPSNVYAWVELAKTNGGEILTVGRPINNNWTTAVLETLNTNTAIVTVPHCHWTDGSFLDLVAIGKRCRELGAAFVIDSTQATGAYPMDVKALQPDFIACSAYKWLLSPYTLGFLYAAPHRQLGTPIELHNLNHAEGPEMYTDELSDGAGRYHMSERFNYTNIPMAIDAMTQIKKWGVSEIHETLSHLIDYTANKATNAGWVVPAKEHRIGHFTGMTRPEPIPPHAIHTLRSEKIYLSPRGTGLRVSPHLFNTTADIDRLFHVLENL